METGELTSAGDVVEVESPAFLAISHSKRFLYAVSEVVEWPESTVTAYAIDSHTGGLTAINTQPTRGRAAAFVTINRTDQYVFAANYSEGHAAALFPVRKDGGLNPASDAVMHSGSSANKARQERPHGHSVFFDAAERWAYVVDLGIDQVMIYRFDHENGRLHRIGALMLAPGAGPRHMAFHPNGRTAYVINELDSTITAAQVDNTSGALTAFQTISTLPDGFTSSTCSDIQVHSSGKFLYGANRGHDSIAMFSIDESSGRLTALGHEPTQGDTPRNFAFDPTGTFLLAANQDTDTIVTFRVNMQTGLLEPTGHVLHTPTPVCLKLITL